MLALGQSPRLPTSPAASSDKTSPNKFDVKMWSNISGCLIRLYAAASTYISSYEMWCSSNTRAQTSRKRISDLSTFALWTIVIFFTFQNVKKITIVHKANVLKSDILFRDVCARVLEEHHISYDEMYVDAAAYNLIKHPELSL